MNVAARLEQAASPGEILVGEQTLRLTRDAVEVEPVEPLDLKGKSDRVSAYRLIAVRPDAAAIERHLEGPMVGRTDELDLLARAYPAAAEAALRPAWEGFMKIGDDWFAPIAAVDLARAIVAQERAQEALEILATIDEESIAPDPEILVNRRAVLGRTLARLGRAEEAEAAATEAVEIASQADFLIFHGDALLDYADVLRGLGRGAEVPPLARRAAEIYTRKGAVVPAAKAMALAAAGTPA